MSDEFEHNPADWVTVGTVGEPGARTFYLQSGLGGEVVTLLLEKEQVDAMARHVQALLIRIGETDVVGPEAAAKPAPPLVDPLEPRFRVGQMALGYDADRDLVLLQCEEYVPEDDEDEDDEEDDDEPEAGEWTVADLLDDAVAGRGRIWGTRSQMRSLAAQGVQLVAQGRPRCRLCGQPIDPAGHFCPARNGHREIGEIR